MKVSSIAIYQQIRNNLPIKKKREEVNTSNNSDIRERFLYPNLNCVNFTGNRNKIDYALRNEQLKYLGLSEEYIAKISKYPPKRYSKALKLLESGCYEECVDKISKFQAKRYNMAVNLLEHNIIDENLFPLVELNRPRFRRIIDLKDKGIDAKDLEAFSQLSANQFRTSKQMMSRGYFPIDAAYLSILTPEQRKIAIELLKKNVEPTTASSIATLDETKQNIFKGYIDDGMRSGDAEELTALNEGTRELAKKYIEMGIGDENSIDIAQMNEKQRAKVLQLYSEGVHPDYLKAIVLEEEEGKQDFAYSEYRNRGYSRTSAYSAALLEDNQIDSLAEIMEEFPEIKDLFKDEYDISVFDLQDDEKTPAVLLTKQQFTQDGTTIKITRFFDLNGNKTTSRTEEYKNHATSSSLESCNDVFRIKYDKSGDIREMTELIQAPETREVIGVLHSTASQLLPGVLETTFYDINDFKTSSDNNGVDAEIKDSVNSDGIKMSYVEQEKDGTIKYIENFNFNGMKTSRKYSEKRDRNNNITESSYTYKIKDENNETILDVTRKTKTIDENHKINIINGITYNLEFDDNTKSIIVSDGKRSRKLNFNDKLAYYSKETLWNAAKNLPVDDLITIHDSVKQWNYCKDEDSIADGYCDILSSGTNTSIIAHEAGHFTDYNIDRASTIKEFTDVYQEEMNNFALSIPYNEYDFITYFSPRADLIETSGKSEIVAEANIILNSYGTNADRLNTRPQFLVRYFPKTIAKIAEITGKNSRKSLLEK